MSVKEEILEIINKYPKHFTKLIKKNVVYWDWVVQNSTTNSNLDSAKIYSALNDDNGICSLGKNKSFKSITHGFKFCGKANICSCAKSSVSEKVSTKKNSRTLEQITEENEKRKNTSLSKYGVINNGQLESAKRKHKELYLDSTKVKEITAKVKQTKLERHGSSGYNNRTKSIETNKIRYGVDNPWMLNSYKQNPNLIHLKNKELLQLLYPRYTVEEIAEKLQVHKQTVYYHLGMHGLKEPYKSSFEQEIIMFLNSYGITNIICNNRTLIGKELDIFLPDYKLAIEYNGEYWHHTDVPHIDRTYHYNKFIKCEQLGITLFTIFGNSWKNKKDAWKKKICSKLGLVTDKVFARKTKIVDLKQKQTRHILEENHIQGYCTSQIAYGLVESDQLVAVMTFSKNRLGIGKVRESNSYELVRYVTSKKVIGGASKLLNHFIKIHDPSLIVSYSDNLYSIGDMYKKLDFVLENENKVGYWYYDPVEKKSYHRFNFRKQLLINQGYDKNKSEAEIMKERGFLKIFDCGSRTWIKHCSNI